ncbi:helix-turn-helix domain-containing protein [Collinsella intestinalis]|uniref:helix-turn-helix domain-containing protein n=1 Tax=Collinsella intestinalis TaxID=147207 RepID=UPI00267357D3|nr:helix-turn-helix domain-containing protein [Collinsella intestinalis]
MCSSERLEQLANAAAAGNYSELPNPLRPEEAAVIARCSTRTITRACSDGRLKAGTFGGRWNVNRDSLLHFAGLI